MPPHHPPCARQSGMTLVEVMVGFVLVGILLVGMNALWVTVVHQIDGSVLRQQAILRLNGEMERLSVLFLNSTGPTGAIEVTDYATAAPMTAGYEVRSYVGTSPTGVFRYIYPDSYAAYFTNDPTVFDTAITDVDLNANTVYRRIFYFDNGTVGNTADDRNLVWLDKDRRIVGQLSWELLPVRDINGERPCYPNGNTAPATPCRLLTLFLDYPFRFSAANPRGAAGAVETITLQTIVGQRP